MKWVEEISKCLRRNLMVLNKNIKIDIVKIKIVLILLPKSCMKKE